MKKKGWTIIIALVF